MYTGQGPLPVNLRDALRTRNFRENSSVSVEGGVTPLQAIRVHNRMHQMVQGAQIQVPGRAIFVRRVRLRAGPAIIEPANKVSQG